MEKMAELYTLEYCLDRLYKKAEQDMSNKKKFRLKKLEIIRKDKKTTVVNFAELCIQLNRDKNSVKTFIEKHLEMKSSICGVDGNMLLIEKMVDDRTIYGIIEKYAKTFVVCSQQGCESGDTELVKVKEQRLLYLKCNTCNSQKSIDY